MGKSILSLEPSYRNSSGDSGLTRFEVHRLLNSPLCLVDQHISMISKIQRAKLLRPSVVVKRDERFLFES